MDQDIANACIMIVEDDRDNRQLLELTFRTSGFTNIVEVPDGRQAVDTFAEKRPDMLLVDLHMPHTDGLEIIDGIRGMVSDDEFLPIVMLSGDVSPEVKRRATELGATDFLLKPYEMGTLVALVEESLSRRLQASSASER